MELLVHARLEPYSENNNLIYNFQFGFRRERFVLHCTSALTLDILQGFSQKRSTATVALDIKRAFNALLPSAVLAQLDRDNKL